MKFPSYFDLNFDDNILSVIILPLILFEVFCVLLSFFCCVDKSHQNIVTTSSDYICDEPNHCGSSYVTNCSYQAFQICTHDVVPETCLHKGMNKTMERDVSKQSPTILSTGFGLVGFLLLAAPFESLHMM